MPTSCLVGWWREMVPVWRTNICAHPACLLTIACIPGGWPCSVGSLGACPPLGILKCSWALGLYLLSVHLHLLSHPLGGGVGPETFRELVQGQKLQEEPSWTLARLCLHTRCCPREAGGGGLVSESHQLGCRLLWARPHWLLGA